MKRNKLVGYLTENGCILDREGGNHTVYFNPATKKVTAIPRHNEIDDRLCNKICKQLGVPKIK
jgi:predicted RNA binding protein YcfA (HicA-like mRNA interferase family)